MVGWSALFCGLGHRITLSGVLLSRMSCKSFFISSFFNFNVNYRFVYDRDESYGKSLVKYYCLAIPVMFLSTALLKLVAVWTKIDQLTAGMNKTKSAVLHTLINAPVDLVIMIGNYLAQKYWVFVKKK